MRLASVILLLLFITASHTRAEESCHPLTMLTSLEMRIGSDGRIYVPATINGQPKSMQVDTGAIVPEISQETVYQLLIGPRERLSKLRVVDRSGDSILKVAVSLKLGNLDAEDVDFMVMPDMNWSPPEIKDLGGVLGSNLLRSYDLELDFDNKTVNILSPDHCPGKVLYWHAPAVAVVPMTVTAAGRILVPIKIDGHPLSALIDTGSPESMFHLESAPPNLDLKLGSPGTPLLSPETKRKSALYEHRFSTLEIEGIRVSNPLMSVWSDARQHFDPRKIREPVDVVLGMDILRHLHFYIAYKEQKLYITPAETPAPTASPPRPASAPPHNPE